MSRPGPRLQKRSLSLSGHSTSLALEPEFWAVLEDLAGGEPMSALVSRIDAARGETPLASACRLAALRHLARRSEDAGPG